MISIKFGIVENVIKQKDIEKDIENQWTQAKEKLGKIDRSEFNERENVYLDKVIKLFSTKNIIIDKPDILSEKKCEIGKVPTPCLKDKILDCLGYKKLRTTFYPKYFQKIGIKSCVYCNSQLSVSIDVEEKLKTKIKAKFKAKFQVDHYHNKAKYPFLSISLYNLYPVCASCNLAKEEKGVNFELYSDKENTSKYKFELEQGSVSKYLLNRNSEDINFIFIDPDNEESLKEILDIEGIYNTQKDVAEEIIIKSMIYNDSYKHCLFKSFPDIFSKQGLFNRVILGNYADEKDIHKRPMSKFVQDIARQLRLIE
jgi:hypothetical protein